MAGGRVYCARGPKSRPCAVRLCRRNIRRRGAGFARPTFTTVEQFRLVRRCHTAKEHVSRSAAGIAGQVVPVVIVLLQIANEGGGEQKGDAGVQPRRFVQHGRSSRKPPEADGGGRRVQEFVTRTNELHHPRQNHPVRTGKRGSQVHDRRPSSVGEPHVFEPFLLFHPLLCVVQH